MTTEVECPKEILYLKVGLFPHVSSLLTLTAIRSKCLIAMETKLNCGKFIILCHKCFFLQLLITFWRQRPLINFYDNIKCFADRAYWNVSNTQMWCSAVDAAAIQALFFTTQDPKVTFCLAQHVTLIKWVSPNLQTIPAHKGRCFSSIWWHWETSLDRLTVKQQEQFLAGGFGRALIKTF